MNRSIGVDKSCRANQAVSNVIVVVLSLVILTVVFANVFLWTQEMNRLDWERTKEDLNIIHVSPARNSPWFPTQNEFSVTVGSLANGTYFDTQSTNNVSETFSEGAAFLQAKLHPNAPGQYAQWGASHPEGTAHWACCDDATYDEDNSYVEDNTAAWKKESYNLQNSTSSGTISWVRIYVRVRLTQAGPSGLRILMRTYHNDYESENITLTTAYQDYFTQYNTNPNTGAQWTWSEIDSLEAGASYRKTEGGQYVRMTTVWIVVNYWVPGGQSLDVNGTYNIDLSTYPLTSIQTIAVQLRYEANDTGESWFLKAYNWTSLIYSDSGFNVSGHSPTGDWDIYAVNFTDAWSSYINSNGTVLLKLQDAQTDPNQTSIDIDFLALRVVIDGAKLTFQYKGSVTCHLVSLWVNNSTHHRRHAINIYINSGEAITYIASDVSLPRNPCVVKVVSDRGNISVFPVE